MWIEVIGGCCCAWVHVVCHINVTYWRRGLLLNQIAKLRTCRVGGPGISSHYMLKAFMKTIEGEIKNTCLLRRPFWLGGLGGWFLLMALWNKTGNLKNWEQSFIKPLLLKARICHSTKRGYSLALIIMNAVYLEVGINQTMKNWTAVFLTSKLEAGSEHFPPQRANALNYYK